MRESFWRYMLKQPSTWLAVIAIVLACIALGMQ